MTAITTGPLTASSAALLRFAMRADATICAALGLVAALVADQLSRLSGLSATAAWVVGAGLVACGALLYVLAAVPDIRRTGIGVVAVNVAFATVVVTVVTAGWLPLTEFGVALAWVLAAATLGVAYVQYRGVRRLA